MLSTMESDFGRPAPDSSAAAAALNDAAAARRSMAAGVVYPKSYVPLVAIMGAGVMLLAGVGSGAASTVVTLLFGAVGLCSVVAAVVATRRFEARNGMRVHAVRGPGSGLSLLMIMSTVALTIAVSGIADEAGAWWLGVIAAPVGAAIQVVYAKRWPTVFRGQA